MRVSLQTIAWVAVTATLALVPAAAFAQEDGVTLDPSSPAAKEYALPTELARREAAGSGDLPVPQGAAAAERFGVGVTPDDQKSPATSAASPTSPGSPAADTTANPTVTTEASAGVGATAVLVGGGIAALLAAGLGGFALRAVRGPIQK